MRRVMIFPIGLMLAALAAPVIGQAADAQPDLQMLADAVAANGMTCDLGPLALRQNNDERWVVEFRCASADDGRIVVMPKKAGAKPIVYNCATAKIGNISCSNTKEAAAMPLVNADIRKYDGGSECRPTQTRVIGLLRGGASAYFEVQCENKKMNGQVLQYDTATLKPMALLDCYALVTNNVGAECRFPGSVINIKAATGPQSMSSYLPGTEVDTSNAVRGMPGGGGGPVGGDIRF